MRLGSRGVKIGTLEAEYYLAGWRLEGGGAEAGGGRDRTELFVGTERIGRVLEGGKL